MKKKQIYEHWYDHTLFKTFRIMRLTLGLLLVLVIQGWATESYSQKTVLNLNMKNAQLLELLDAIEKQTDYFFLFNYEQIRTDKKFDVQVSNKKIDEALDLILKGTNLTYSIKDRQIIISKEGSGQAIDEGSNIQQQKSVIGKVTDLTGIPLPGVSVVIKGTTTGSITDSNGNYSLSNVPANATLQFSFVGMKTQEIAIGGKPTINVALAEESIGIEEVVAVGYGTQKKVNLTGSVSQVSSDKLANRPVSNVGQALQGVVPNLNVSITSGSPNSMPSFNIRGGTSFADGQILKGNPLILVDGVEMDINLINPNDIESISVLKDAASSAIYGARAAYGVMLVTTKKGTKGDRMKISYDNSFQFNSPSAIPDLLDNYDSQLVRMNALKLINQSIPSDMTTRLEKIKAYNADPTNVNPYYMIGDRVEWIANTDVYNLAVKKNSPMQKHNFSLSGGSDKTTYYASIGYQQQDGLYKINTDKSKRYNLMFNLTTEIFRNFSVELRTAYNKRHFDEPVSPGGKGGWWIAMDRDPAYNINMPMKTPANSPVGVQYTDNILSFMDYGSRNNIDEENIVFDVSPVYTILKNWKVKGDFAYKSNYTNQKQIIPELQRVEFAWSPLINVHTWPSSVFYSKYHSNQYTVNAYTDYSFTKGKHSAYGLLGFNQEWFTSDYLDATGEILLSPSIPFISQTLGVNKYIYDTAEEWALRGGFFRLTYNYDGKYLLETNGRYDGTSKFPKNDRYKYFQSFSGAWRVTKENFAQAITPVVNDLKLRASYGSLGNQNVANYMYVPSYSTVAQENQIFDGTRPVGIAAPGLVSPNLTWETATTIDFGFDMTLFKKLELNYDWYSRKTSDILVSGDKFPAVLGADAPTKNSGAMKTNGWELTAKWKDNLKNGLRYDLTFILSDYVSKITEFDGNPNKLLNTLYAGQTAGEIWGYETVGTFQNQAQIEAAPSQALINSGKWYPGDIQYKDLNDDKKIGPGAGTLDDSGDRKIIGNNTPRYQFGFNTNFAYKGFDLNLFFQGVAKRDFWISNLFYWGLIRSSRSVGTYDTYRNSWTPEKTDAFFPAYKPKTANMQPQTKYLINAAYLRLKNITLGYTLPKEWTKVARIDHARVYASTYNIWAWSKAPKIFDPETLSEDYPMIESFAFGLQLTF